MITEVRVVVSLFTLYFVNSQIYLDNTNDGLDIESFDCVRLQSLEYCRRPQNPINLTRDNDTNTCTVAAGKVHRFSELRSKNISVDTLVQQWRSTFERIEEYSLFLKDPTEQDGSICQCLHQGSFGKNCEYQLPVGHTMEQTLQ